MNLKKRKLVIQLQSNLLHPIVILPGDITILTKLTIIITKPSEINSVPKLICTVCASDLMWKNAFGKYLHVLQTYDMHLTSLFTLTCAFDQWNFNIKTYNKHWNDSNLSQRSTALPMCHTIMFLNWNLKKCPVTPKKFSGNKLKGNSLQR